MTQAASLGVAMKSTIRAAEGAFSAASDGSHTGPAFISETPLLAKVQ
jgi:hypothetical protein